jgi:hypothetical protein
MEADVQDERIAGSENRFADLGVEVGWPSVTASEAAEPWLCRVVDHGLMICMDRRADLGVSGREGEVMDSKSLPIELMESEDGGADRLFARLRNTLLTLGR